MTTLVASPLGSTDERTTMLGLQHRRFRRASAAAAGATLLLLGLAPAAAHAAVTETTADLPFTTVADVVATDAAVFVSGGPTSDSIAVTDPSGANPRTIGDLPGPSDLE